ncbi:hypothetical protein PG993_002046 [Apiospora rasikravindrae]|uniref:HIT-type domain-containing protein n=1 Tax=Apiospora rasikravindrae TaxID=990691 RepID=A0ABR1UD47_9PEZI
MNNFGVIEVAGAKTTNAPGWAYVPDTGPPGLSHQQGKNSKNRKRAARSTAGGPNLSYADLSARQEAKVRKELEVLDRDNPRDVSIPIPAKPKGSGSGRDAAAAKHTPNVRKILQSQKTFANHLDDWLALKEGGGIANTGGTATPATGGGGTSSSRSAAAAAAAALSGRKGSAQQHKKSETPNSRGGASSAKQQQPKQDDVEMTDAPNAFGGEGGSTILSPYRGPLPAPHPRDDDLLLVSRVPPMPTDEELKALLAAPPLTYLEARAGWGAEDRKYPVRVFCEVCGYWGRVKCIKCGTRVCALDCLDTHHEECVTRYGL